MARDPLMEARLQRWAEWITVGDGSGYPKRCVLHEDWSIPPAGSAPSLKVAAPLDARATHRAVAQLSMRLANTLVVHYVLRLPIDEQAARLGCQRATVYQRVEQAHALLAKALPGVFET